jgi:hypothetical protein
MKKALAWGILASSVQKRVVDFWLEAVDRVEVSLKILKNSYVLEISVVKGRIYSITRLLGKRRSIDA